MFILPIPAVDFDLKSSQAVEISTGFSAIIPGTDDGKVAIDKTKVEGMNAHITLPVNHATMMNTPEVLEQVLAYLNDGDWRVPTE